MGGEIPPILRKEYVMAFTTTVVDRWTNGGKFYEKGRWTLSGGDTSGVITPEFTGHGLSAGIREIQDATVGSDSNVPLAYNYSISGGLLRITSSIPDDVGEYSISGWGC